MSDLYDPRREPHAIIGLSLSERDQDFWDDLGSKSTLRGKTSDRDLFPTDSNEGDQCLNLLPGRSTCSRRDDHPGRHMAVLGNGDTIPRTVCSAWPGTHRPTIADLEA
jgi:hypothetical protein